MDVQVCRWRRAELRRMPCHTAAALQPCRRTARQVDLKLHHAFGWGTAKTVTHHNSTHLEARELVVDGLLRGAVQHAGVVDDVLRRRLRRLQCSGARRISSD